MNHIIITTLLDLQTVANEPLNLSEKQTSTYFPNMWALTFDDQLIKTIQLDDLKIFFTELIDKWRLQLSNINPRFQAKFYLWFDKQALQLRFNLLLDIHFPLPFGCKLDITDSLQPILNEFLIIGHQLATDGETIEFFDPATDVDNDDETDNYILKVYVKIIEQ